MSEPEILIERDPDACAAIAADRIAASLTAAVAVRGRADWATTGGSSPIGIYRELTSAGRIGAVAWNAVHVWWGDDRYVPRDHTLSNVKSFDDIMLGIAGGEEGTTGGGVPGVPIPLDQVHPFPTGESIGRALGAAWCAGSLAERLRAAGMPERGGWPVFDLILLGVGSDAHLLSVFPGSSAFEATELGLAIPAPTHIEPHVERVTLHPGVIEIAADVLIVATGADKAPILAAIFGPDRDPHRWPAQLARRSGATWILDEAAAAELPR
jgi:6-phosphogluconolactonase